MRGAGSWIARFADGRGGNRVVRVGTADDFENADAQNILDWWHAIEPRTCFAAAGAARRDRRAAQSDPRFGVAGLWAIVTALTPAALRIAPEPLAPCFGSLMAAAPRRSGAVEAAVTNHPNRDHRASRAWFALSRKMRQRAAGVSSTVSGSIIKTSSAAIRAGDQIDCSVHKATPTDSPRKALSILQ
jgi:hypothetical protein